MAAHGGQTGQLVPIREVSSSKGSMMIPRGNRHGIQLEDKATFLKVDPQSLHTELVGQARAVRVYPRHSLWYFEQTQNTQALEAGEFLDMLTQRDALRGRATPPPPVRHLRVLLPSRHAQEWVEGESTSPGLVKRDHNTNGMAVALEEELGPGIEPNRLVDLSEWIEEEDNQGVFFPRPFRTGPKAQQVLQSKREGKHREIIQLFLKQQKSGWDEEEEAQEERNNAQQREHP